jgi:hypothetical protein
MLDAAHDAVSELSRLVNKDRKALKVAFATLREKYGYGGGHHEEFDGSGKDAHAAENPRRTSPASAVEPTELRKARRVKREELEQMVFLMLPQQTGGVASDEAPRRQMAAKIVGDVVIPTGADSGKLFTALMAALPDTFADAKKKGAAAYELAGKLHEAMDGAEIIR